LFSPLRDNRHPPRARFERDNNRRAESPVRNAEIIIANVRYYLSPGFSAFLRELAATQSKRRLCARVPDRSPQNPTRPSRIPPRARCTRHWLSAQVAIVEYCERPYHGKVAIIDDDWATIGSSNLDPLSLSLNLEANIFVRDRAFVQALRESLDALRQRQCHAIEGTQLGPRRWWHAIARPVLFHVCGASRAGPACCRRTRHASSCSARTKPHDAHATSRVATVAARIVRRVPRPGRGVCWCVRRVASRGMKCGQCCARCNLRRSPSDWR
jgi:hypothetical protein